MKLESLNYLPAVDYPFLRLHDRGYYVSEKRMPWDAFGDRGSSPLVVIHVSSSPIQSRNLEEKKEDFEKVFKDI